MATSGQELIDRATERMQQAIRKIVYRAGQGQHIDRVNEATSELTSAINDGRRLAVAQSFEDMATALREGREKIGAGHLIDAAVADRLEQWAAELRGQVAP